MPVPSRNLKTCCLTLLINFRHGNSFQSHTFYPFHAPKNLPKHGQTISTLVGNMASNDVLIPPNLLGPPEPLRNLKIGQYLDAFRRLQRNDEKETVNFTIERVAYKPDIYCLRNFVTQPECKEIQTLAKATAMKHAETVTENDTYSRKNCSVAWIPLSGPNKSSLVSDLVASTANILLSNSVLSHPSAGVEDLQVLRYDIGGEFVLHHDGEPRMLTVIYYINGVGGTWFPLACTSNDDNGNPRARRERHDRVMGDNFDRSRQEPQNKAQALDLVKDLTPGKEGLLIMGTCASQRKEKVVGGEQRQSQGDHVVLINQGDVVAFYNYLDDGSARLDWRSLHCGLPTTEEDGTKWIANHWYCLNSLVDIGNN